MVIPVVFLLISFGAFAVALVVPGMSDLLMIAGPALLAGLYLLLRAWLVARRSNRKTQLDWIVIDGSNVMHWADETPRIEPLREVVTYLQDRGFTPGVVFDANAGYLLTGRYRHDHAFGKLLGLPPERVMVVGKGEPADPKILTAAQSLGARVVTNDRFRDWADQFPDVRKPGFLIRGGYREGRLRLDLEQPTAARQSIDLQQTAMR